MTMLLKFSHPFRIGFGASVLRMCSKVFWYSLDKSSRDLILCNVCSSRPAPVSVQKRFVTFSLHLSEEVGLQRTKYLSVFHLTF